MSSIKENKITTDEVTRVFVQRQADVLSGTPQQNKQVFDEYPDLIRTRLNKSLDDISDILDDGEIRIQTLEEAEEEQAERVERAETAANIASSSASQAVQALAEAESMATKRFTKRFVVSSQPISEIEFSMSGYTYEPTHRYMVFVDGLKLNEGEYTLSNNVITFANPVSVVGSVIDIVVDSFSKMSQVYGDQQLISAHDGNGTVTILLR